MLHNPYSNHYYEVPNPSSPSSIPIPNGLVPGKQLFVSGTVLPHADSFSFNLEGHGAVHLHINPRFGQNCVVRNSNIGSWGSEERQGGLPFRRGEHFELIVLVEVDRYKVAVNGQHFFDFLHRSPFHDVTHLAINGALQINRVVFSGGASSRVHEVHRPALPFAAPLAHGVHPGTLIQISGHVPHHANRFEINLQNGPNHQPNEIPLHFNPRFDDPHTPLPVVIRTNRAYGNWGNEERHGNSPFQRGSHFDLLILVEHNEYKIAVNGQHFVSFAHRSPFEEANHLAISGDVEIHSVRFF